MNLSVIIPAYNESKRITNTVIRISKYLKEKNHDYEIIVVDDGSRDNTAEIVSELSKEYENLSLVKNGKNKGKGYSVKNGMLHAERDYLLFSDADLSTPIEEIEKFLPWLKEGYDVVIASRALKGSDIKIKQPFYRVFIGKTFNKIVQIIATRGIKDTQCGFKLFTKKAAKRIFPKQKLERFGFDVEILYLTKKFGFKIKEVPVIWINAEGSKVSPIKDSIDMLKDLFIIRLNDLLGKYKEN